MKAIAICGSPRKGWNTDLLLQEALKGAESMGAETEMVYLYDLDYKGCVSCFGCRVKGAESYRCRYRDALTPVLDKILEADAVFFGTPIYLEDITGQMSAFQERLFFPMVSYDDFGKNIFPGKINAAYFFTMNAPRDFYESHMKPFLMSRLRALSHLGGKLEVRASCNTMQFTDYSRYHTAMFDVADRRRSRAEQFPKELAEAYEIGRKMMEK